MKKNSNQRKLRNYLFVNKAQMTLGISHLILLLLMFGIMIVTILSPLYTVIFQSEDVYVQHMSSEIFLLMLQRSALSFGILLVIIVLHQVFFVHKICGPLVSFKHTLDRLERGDFTRRVYLRRNDFFKAEARQLNEMMGNISALVRDLREHQKRIAAALEKASASGDRTREMDDILAEVSAQARSSDQALSTLKVEAPVASQS
jgi:methyl-accepting chemotaxis protein